jgi:hypothetical protein
MHPHFAFRRMHNATSQTMKLPEADIASGSFLIKTLLGSCEFLKGRV